MAPSRIRIPKESSLKNTAKKASQAESVKNPASLNWPAFLPLVPVEDLACDFIVPGQIITISQFLDLDVVQKLRRTSLRFAFSHHPRSSKEGRGRAGQ